MLFLGSLAIVFLKIMYFWEKERGGAMAYESLRTVYYKKPDEYQEEYEKRFSAPFTKHFNINIRQFNHRNSYPAFVCYTEEMLLAMEDIARENDNLNWLLVKMPDIGVQQFAYSTMIDEIISTNQIEGIHSTRKEITEALKKQYETRGITRFWSVVNKYQKIIKGEEIDFTTVQAVRKFYDEFILDEVINLEPDNRPDGKIFRKDSVSIGAGKDIHRGLYPETEIIKAMDTALNILNDTSIPYLVRVAVFHYLFGYIHPFYDGNGRTSRFITSYYLSAKINLLASLRISVNIKGHREKYYSLFEETNSEFNRGDLSLFVIEFLNLILATIVDVQETIKTKLIKLQKYEEILNKKLAGDGIKDALTIKIYNLLLHSVLFSPYGFTVEELVEKTGKSRNTIDSRLSKIPPEHMIKETDTRPFRYRLNSMMLK